jgi:inorganic pyrophosphatase
MTEKNDNHFMTNFYRAHPWHGIDPGSDAPEIINCYIEIVPTDTIKYELDKESGLLKIDRPQKYSNYCPALYGFIPQTYCGKRIAKFCQEKTQRESIVGDGDPLDICVLTEKPILRSDILLKAIPIGGFRCLDKGEADDKIIAVLEGDLVYGGIKSIAQCPYHLIERLQHYFLTYKSAPDQNQASLEIVDIYGRQEALDVIDKAYEDYKDEFHSIHKRFIDLQNKSN